MYLDKKIRSLFKKIDPLDYKYSKFINNIYKLLSAIKLIYQFRNQTKKVDKNIDLEEKGFTQINSEEKVFNLILNKYSNMFKSKKFKDAFENSKKQFLNSYKINLLENDNHIFLKFLFQNNLIGTISSYLGRYFTLNGAYIFYSKNEIFEHGRSQELHLDGDALKQLKIFVHLSDVDLNSGPLNVMPRNVSKILFSNFRKQHLIKTRSTKISDDKVQKNILEKISPLIGKRGTINIVDTSNCYHYGSRPGNRERVVLLFQFVSSFSYRVRYFPNKDLITKSEYLNNFEISQINKWMRFSDF